MVPYRSIAVFLVAMVARCGVLLADQPDPRLAELDALWAEVGRAVREGDFETYAARCHPEGVLVSEPKGLSQPLSAALARWKPEFAATREGRMTAEVEMRFARRLGDATTAHESGMFRYTSRMEGKESQTDFVPFDALLVKRGGRWLILMEHQKAHATPAEWEKLAPGAGADSR
jgi:hypothetical protein